MQFAIVARVSNVQVRGVPEDVHRRLKAQAALAGQSLNEFLLARLREQASRRPHSRPSAVRRAVQRRRDPRGSRRPVIVLDASVLTDFLLGRRATVAALESELAGADQAPLHAPQVIELETLNALRRLARAGVVSDQRATEAASDLADARLIRYPHEPLSVRVWQLRHNLTAYDAAYLALAEALDDPLLMTADAGLASVARASLGEARVRQLV
jgi:predicted nucleic acid-binding protein